jgi:anti-repressor protein
MNELQIFNNAEFGQIRTVTKDNEPMFCLGDLCRALDLTSKGVRQRLSDEVISTYPIEDALGRMQNSLFVNEDGLYDVILESRKDSAKKFRKWVTSEVLPSIRKSGGYIAGQEQMSDSELMAKALLVAQKQIEERNKQIEVMKPKAIFADAVATSKTSILVGDLAKLICQNGYQIGQKRLFEWLRENGYLIKSGNSYNMPMQRYVEQGLFEVKESNVQNPDGSVRITRTTKVTGKGQVYFVNKFLGKE